MHYKNTHFKVVEKPSTHLFFFNIKCKLLIFYLYPHKSVDGFLGLVTDVFTVHKIKVLYVLGIKNINVYQHTNGSVHKRRLLLWNMMHDPCFLAAVHYGVQKWYLRDLNQPNLSQTHVACMKLPT